MATGGGTRVVLELPAAREEGVEEATSVIASVSYAVVNALEHASRWVCK